jgi:uncharacterized membrane protein
MYSGLFQYNAEIVPILIIATIEALVLLLWLMHLIDAEWKLMRTKTRLTTKGFPQWLCIWWQGQSISNYILLVSLGLALFSSIRYDDLYHGHLPFSQNFHWPTPSAHTILAQQLIEKIPADASVSAQSQFVPHLSHRSDIYLFPYAMNQVQYIFLDVTSDVYPYYGFNDYLQGVKNIMSSGQYDIVAAQDGYLLLRRRKQADTGSCPMEGQGQDSDPGLLLSILLNNVCSQSSDRRMAKL